MAWIGVINGTRRRCCRAMATAAAALLGGSPAARAFSSQLPHYTITPEVLQAIERRMDTFNGPLPLIQLPKSIQTANSSPREAAVCIPLCNSNGDAAILFQVRSSGVKTHKSQVSFPGGHIEESETAIEAALRETREEIGEEIGPMKVLGTCQRLPAVTGTMVTPILIFVANDVGDLSHLTLSKDEVDSVFVLTFSQLLDPALRGTEDLGPRGRNMPYFLGGPGGARVWGLTGIITEGIVQRLIRPTLLGT